MGFSGVGIKLPTEAVVGSDRFGGCSLASFYLGLVHTPDLEEHTNLSHSAFGNNKAAKMSVPSQIFLFLLRSKHNSSLLVDGVDRGLVVHCRARQVNGLGQCHSGRTDADRSVDGESGCSQWSVLDKGWQIRLVKQSTGAAQVERAPLEVS